MSILQTTVHDPGTFAEDMFTARMPSQGGVGSGAPGKENEKNFAPTLNSTRNAVFAGIAALGAISFSEWNARNAFDWVV